MRDIGNGGSDEGERDDRGRKNERERWKGRDGEKERYPSVELKDVPAKKKPS